MDINNLDISERELMCDAIKIAISPEVIVVNDRFWGMEALMQEIINELMADGGFSKLGCEHESWGLICDAIELAISPEVIKVNDRFRNQKKYMGLMVKEIEDQSGCMTHED